MRALILIALSLLVGCSQPKQAQVTIRAVGPTGDTFYRPPQPIWRFAITNAGKCDVVWEASVSLKDARDEDFSNAGGHIDSPQGILAPGRGLVTEMIVPAKKEIAWRARVEFWALAPEDLKKAKENAARLGGLSVSEFSPRRGDMGTFHDGWHQ